MSQKVKEIKLRPGWLERQFKECKEAMAELPAWLKTPGPVTAILHRKHPRPAWKFSQLPTGDTKYYREDDRIGWYIHEAVGRPLYYESKAGVVYRIIKNQYSIDVAYDIQKFDPEYKNWDSCVDKVHASRIEFPGGITCMFPGEYEAVAVRNLC